MSWKDKHRDYVKPKRPKVRKLSKAEFDQLLEEFTSAVRKSPVLVALGCNVTVSRGRFYVERSASNGPVPWGRITPLDGSNESLLESPGRGINWYEVARGNPNSLIKAIASDCLGTFHGLGSVDAFLRSATRETDQRKLLRSSGTPKKPAFQLATGKTCSAQVALAGYFGIPIDVLIEPRHWYSYHRRPLIVEFSPDLTRVLVQFRADTLTSTIIGVCLYLKHPPTDLTDQKASSQSGNWGAYTIRPSESESIAQAEAWLVKRKWLPW